MFILHSGHLDVLRLARVLCIGQSACAFRHSSRIRAQMLELPDACFPTCGVGIPPRRAERTVGSGCCNSKGVQTAGLFDKTTG